MNGHGTEPPDKLKSDAIALQNEPISGGMTIKHEPTVKQEIEVSGEILMLSRSIHTAIGSLDNSNGGAEADDSDGCFDFYNLDEVTSKVKIEKVKDEANQVPGKSCDKDQPQNKAKKRCINEMEPKPGAQMFFVMTHDGDVNKSVTEATKYREANRTIDKEKPTEGNANGKRHKCSLCDYVTNIKTNSKRHMLKHTGERPFPCSLCQKRFTRKQHLQSHMKTHVDEFLFSCSNCLDGFHRSEEKVEHESGCKMRRYECHLCKEYSSSLKTNLKRHLRVHTGERPFECDQCSKTFNLANNLERHRKSHANPRPLKIKCSSCFKSFAQQKEKDYHEVNCKRRGYRCDLCKSYTTDHKPNLMSHMRVHTHEKPFRCETCSKCFSRKAHLNQHKIIHK